MPFIFRPLLEGYGFFLLKPILPTYGAVIGWLGSNLSQPIKKIDLELHANACELEEVEFRMVSS